MGNLSEIGLIIEHLMDSPQLKKRWTEYLIKSKWTGLVGEKMAQHIMPGTIDQDKLTVLIDDERWANAFVDLKDKVLEKIYQAIGDQPVRDFIIRMEKKPPVTRRKKSETPVNFRFTKGDENQPFCHSGEGRNPGFTDETKEQTDNHLTPQPSGPAVNQALSKKIEDDLDMIKDLDLRAALRSIIIKSRNSEQ
ncbi:DUF721 domain-containing protein [bacterium]|nr:DUF721 domain-containing protein [bacterium]